jgi:hypothetical protein
MDVGTGRISRVYFKRDRRRALPHRCSNGGSLFFYIVVLLSPLRRHHSYTTNNNTDRKSALWGTPNHTRQELKIQTFPSGGGSLIYAAGPAEFNAVIRLFSVASLRRHSGQMHVPESCNEVLGPQPLHDRSSIYMRKFIREARIKPLLRCLRWESIFGGEKTPEDRSTFDVDDDGVKLRFMHILRSPVRGMTE